MMFFINSRMVSGVTREQVIEHLTKDIDKSAWELIKKGVVTQWSYKVGDEPGIIAQVSFDSMEEVRALADSAPAVKKGLLEFEIDPVDHFPRFD